MTTHIDISPHLTSPVGEGQIPLLLDYQGLITVSHPVRNEKNPAGQSPTGFLFL